MPNPFKAGFVHGTSGSFVVVQPDWPLSPHDSQCSEHTQIASCYFMNSAHARDLARQLIAVADAADARPEDAKRPEAE